MTETQKGATTAPGEAVSWIAYRLGGGLIVVWAAATIVFFAMRLIPGDPAEAILGGPGSQASDEALAHVRREYGLDDPILIQYGRQLIRLVTGELGMSYSLREPVSAVIGPLLLSTMVLALSSLLVGWLLAVLLTLYSTRGSRLSAVVGNALELTAASLPHFWLAVILIVTFSTGLGILPPVSTGTWSGLVLPTLTLGIPIAGFLAQVMRDAFLDALESPFTLTSRSRGASPTRVRLVHALRHAAVPGVNLTAWAFGYLVSGAVVVETIFARPGVGRSLVKAVLDRDVPLVTGIVLVTALAYVIIMIVADGLTRVVDPRTGRRS